MQAEAAAGPHPETTWTKIGPGEAVQAVPAVEVLAIR